MKAQLSARRIRWSRARKDWCIAVLLATGIAAGWHGLAFFDDQTMSDPPSYRGDAYLAYAVVAAARRGDYIPFASKMLPSLGAPFVANWNDFPGTDDVVFYLTGLIARFTDLMVAINIGYLLACITSGVSMFFAARRFGFRREGAFFAGGIFGLSHFIFARTVHHYSLMFVGAMPWVVLVMCYLGSRSGIRFGSKRFWVSVVVTVCVGWSFVYYIFFAAQLYLLGAITGLSRNGRRFKWGSAVTLAGVMVLSTLSVTFDSISNFAKNGPNPGAISRVPHEVELYALKPVSLMIGFHLHRFKLQREMWHREKEQSIVNGEEPAPYLGAIGVLCFLALGATAMVNFSRGTGAGFVVPFAATAGWVLIAHSVGGLNSVMGLFNFTLFRSTNRAAIIILSLSLLFGAWFVPRLLRRAPSVVRWAVAIGLALFAAWEMGGTVSRPESVANNRSQANSDRALVSAMEAVLPEGAMIFQLPVMGFPEVGWAGGVETYELFRPYFYAKNFRFSHGDVKGRPNAEWKFKVAALAPLEMIAALREAGFSAILINQKGFGEGAGAIIDQFTQAGCKVIAVSTLHENVALSLP